MTASTSFATGVVPVEEAENHVIVPVEAEKKVLPSIVPVEAKNGGCR